MTCMQNVPPHGRAAIVLALVGATSIGCSSKDAVVEESERTFEPVSRVEEAVGEAMADFGAGPQSVPLAPITRRKLTPDEMAAAAAAKPEGAPTAPVQEVTDAGRNQATLAKAASMAPSSAVTVLIELEDQPFDFSALEHADDSTLAAQVTARQQQLSGDHHATETAVTAAGGKVTGRLWIGGSAVVASVPVAAIKGLMATPRVRFVEIQVPNARPLTYYDMGDGRPESAMRTQTLIDAGYSAQSGNRVSNASPMRIGIIEVDPGNNNYIRKNHVGYKTWLGVNRVQKVYRCTSSCVALSTPPDAGSHGQAVASVAGGAITFGQDSNFPGTNTADQRARSGHASDASFYYYSYDATNAGHRAALQQAVADGVDVVNMSFGTSFYCDRTQDPGSLNATLTDSRNAGVVLVGCTGNDSVDFTTCMVQWPGTRPDVLAVGGLDSSNDATAYTDTSLELGNLPNGGATAIGGLPVVSHSGVSSTATVVGLMAPGVIRNYFSAPPNTYGTGATGCSLAAPAVAGAAAELRQQFRAYGWTQGADSANVMLVNMLLNGDGWNGYNVYWPGGSSYSAVAPNERSGYGRLRTRWNQTSNGGVTAPSWWAWSRITVYDSDYISIDVNTSGAEPSGTTEYKVAAIWFPSDLGDVSDIDVELWDTCVPSGFIATQNDYDYHNRLRLTGTQVSGKCLQVRLRGFSVKPGGEYVYLAHMYHGGAM